METHIEKHLQRGKKLQEESEKRMNALMKEYSLIRDKFHKKQEKDVNDMGMKHAEFILEIAHRTLHRVGLCMDDIDIILEHNMDKDILQRLEHILELDKEYVPDEVITSLLKEKIKELNINPTPVSTTQESFMNIS